jgi:saccharopine dehydrogenase-like NADP-dependent oxidoreductase
MKILCLGGAGAVCQHAVRDLVQFSDFAEIVIADRDLSAAQALVAELADPRLDVLLIDASDDRALVQTFARFDVVLNGLPWKFDLAVTRACVEAGVSGLDVSTDEDQWDYDGAARDQGIVFVPGVGATPGITNVMARWAADQLDEVEAIEISFAAFRCPAPAPGLLTTLLWEFDPKTQTRVYYCDGEFHRVGPFEGLKRVRFHDPIGEQEVVYIPHPETRTMPGSLGARAVSVRGCFPPHVMRLVRAMLEAGLYGEQPVRICGVQTTPLDAMYELLLQLPESKDTPLWAYGLAVEVRGRQQGRERTIELWNDHPHPDEWGGPAAYYKNIAIPLSIGAQMIAGRQVRSRGVVPPETAFAPEPFIRQLAARGIDVKQRLSGGEKDTR